MKKQSNFVHKIFGSHIFEWLIFLVSFLIFSTISYEILKYKATNAPDFVQNIFFSDLFAKGKTLLYCNELNKEIFPIFGGRGFRLTAKEGCLSHGSMHGFIIILGLAKMIWPDSFYFIVPFFSSLALVFFYKIFNFFFSKKTSLLGTILLLLFPPFFLHSALLFNNIPALAMFLSAVYFLIKGNKENKNWYFLSSLLAGLMVWIRYDYFLLVVPAFFFLLKELIKKSLTIKELFLISLPFCLLLLGLGLTNFKLYGGLFSYEGGEFSSLANSPVNYAGDIKTKKLLPFLPPMSSNIFFTNFYRYLVKDKEILLAFLVFSLFIIFGKHNMNRLKKLDLKDFSWLFLFFIGLQISFYFFSVWNGFQEPQNVLANSYVRYILPAYAFIIFFVVVFLEKTNNIIKSLFLIFFFLWSINISFFSRGGIIDQIKAQKDFSEAKAKYLENIPEKNAVVFTIFADKYIFPDRITAIYNTFNHNEVEEKTVFAMNSLTEKGIPVYFLKEKNSPINNKEFFKNNGFDVIEINNSLLKIELKIKEIN
jgi:cell division protein FtsB